MSLRVLVADDAALIAQLMPEGYRARAEQAILFDVVAWDINCPRHIPQKLDAAAVACAMADLEVLPLDVDALVVAEASVGKSITMKRFHTRGRGKSTRILKPISRLRIVVREATGEEA